MSELPGSSLRSLFKSREYEAPGALPFHRCALHQVPVDRSLPPYAGLGDRKRQLVPFERTDDRRVDEVGLRIAECSADRITLLLDGHIDNPDATVVGSDRTDPQADHALLLRRQRA